MATATAKLNSGFGGRASVREKRMKVRRVVENAVPLPRKRSFLKKFFFASLVFTFFTICISALTFTYFYFHYAAIAEKRIGFGFWQTRAGIYAAPHTLRVGQRADVEGVAQLLRRAGYVEGNQSEVWNGNFTVKGNRIAVEANNIISSERNASIEIVGDRIAAIKTPNKSLESYAIEPEILSGRSEARRNASEALKYEQIPDRVRNAILATEDRRFFEHSGLDFQGIFRAVVSNISHNKIKEGASTITQQLVKNTFLTSERTFERKFAEAFLALALENKMSKSDIFALYCNEIYMGQNGSAGIHGIEQASRTYFGKELKDLSVSEAATIAALIKSPNKYAPHKNYAEAKERRNLVVQKMLGEGMISDSEAESAKGEEIALSMPKTNENSIAPYFVDTVTKELPAKISTVSAEEGDNLRVYTTIDPQLQEMAEKTVNARLAGMDKVYAKKGLTPQAVLIALDPKNGHVLAMVGGRDYADSQFNRATDARRQPGSTFKPFVYAAALQRGALPTTVYEDKPLNLKYDRNKEYKPANYGNSYQMREITMKTALAKSSNVVAVQVAMENGLASVANKARQFGLSRPQAFPSMALGTGEVTPLELAAAYATFANGGKLVTPSFVSKIVSGEGNTIFEEKPGAAEIVSPNTAYMMTDMLTAVVQRGSAQSAKNALGKDVVFAGKTGSSKDGWFVGYTPNLVCLVWIGFDDNTNIELTGGETALPLWVDFMKEAIGARPEFGGKAFPMPAGLKTVTIDAETGMMTTDSCPNRETAVIPASVAVSHCFKHQHFDMLYASNTESYQGYESYSSDESYQPPTVVEADNYSEKENDDAPVDYKSFNDVPYASDEAVEPKTPKVIPPKLRYSEREDLKHNFQESFPTRRKPIINDFKDDDSGEIQ